MCDEGENFECSNKTAQVKTTMRMRKAARAGSFFTQPRTHEALITLLRRACVGPGGDALALLVPSSSLASGVTLWVEQLPFIGIARVCAPVSTGR